MSTDWGYGTTLGYSVVSANSYTTVGNIVEIDEKKLKRKRIDITTLGSANHTMESRGGMLDPQEFKFKLQYSKSVHVTLLGMAVEASGNRDWKITLSDGSTAVGTGYISEFSEVPKSTVDDIYENEISIQAIGSWTFTSS